MSDATAHILAFTATAALLTITPGADTALVLRIAARAGRRPAWLAGIGVVAGVLLWGVIAGIGLGALVLISEFAFRLLQIAGALYLGWLAWQMFQSAFHARPSDSENSPEPPPGLGWFVRGFMTNVLNPKVGLFYVSLLPQFIPTGGDVLSYSVAYAGIHAALGLGFFAILVAATDRVGAWLRRASIARILDGLSGTVLLGFAVRLLATEPS